MGYLSDSEGRGKTPKHIKGVTCDVKSCVYHDGENYCTADRITVGPTYATSCTETVCASYRPKSQLH